MAHVRQFLALIVAALVPGFAWATACPVDPDNPLMVYNGWPTTVSPTEVIQGLSTSLCGVSAASSLPVGWEDWSSLPAAIEAAKAALITRYTTEPDTVRVVPLGAYTSNAVGYCVIHNGANRYIAVAVVTVPEPCEQPSSDFDCSLVQNVITLGSANDQPDTFTPQETICVKNLKWGGEDVPSNCGAFMKKEQPYKRLGPPNARDWLVRYQFTGLACEDDPPQPETDPTDTEDKDYEKCQSGAGGLQWCEGKTPNDSDCGYFNDKYVCLKSLGNDKCFTHTDGRRLCAEGAPTPPVPDNGTKGVKAEPDDQMQVCTAANSCSTFNYYNETTNSSSSRPTGSGGNTDGSGAVGPGGTPAGTGTGGGGDGDGSGDDEAGGGLSCTEPPTCTGDAIQCAQLQQQWRTRCSVERPSDAELLEAIGATTAEKGEEAGPHDGEVEVGEVDSGGFIGGGGCPTPPSFTVKGQTISMDKLWIPACTMAGYFAPIVQAMGFLFAALLLVKGSWS